MSSIDYKKYSRQDFKFTRYHKYLFIIFISFAFLITGLLIYASKASQDAGEIMRTLKTLSPDSLNAILITQANPDWKVNLTIDTIKVKDSKTKVEITSVLNKIHEYYPGRSSRKDWDANLILIFKNGRKLRFEVVDGYEGICLSFTKTMLLPQFKLDGLKEIFERLADYKGNVGGNVY